MTPTPSSTPTTAAQRISEIREKLDDIAGSGAHAASWSNADLQLLLDRVEALEGERDEARRDCTRRTEQRNIAEAENAQLRANVEAMREFCANIADKFAEIGADDDSEHFAAKRIARLIRETPLLADAASRLTTEGDHD